MAEVSPLPQGAGYAVILGLGAVFVIAMNLITWVQAKYTKVNPNEASEFNAASRNVKIGLVVAGIVSSWTWSLTLLQSATESYNLGVSGGYWYGVGGCLQIAIFSIIASKVKANTPHATTFPEIARIRFGIPGQLAFLFTGLVANTVISACILLGGLAVTNALTGMNSYAALMLIPLGVAGYVVSGGLRATFISDAIHTCFLLAILFTFVFTIVGTSDKIGKLSGFHELLVRASEAIPVEGNYHGSYLTFRSRSGGIFAVTSIITGFGLVNCDQAYWSRAIASNPRTTSKAYFIGGVAWFAIPLSCGILGLAARALSATDPEFPALTNHDISAGLAIVRLAQYLRGTAGSVLMLLLIFLSVTSALSGEMIAASTILSYDLYRLFRPHADAKEIVDASRAFVVFWALFAGGVACAFQAAGITMGWLFNFLGVATASGVFPIALTFTWGGLNQAGAVGGSVGGLVIAFVVWLVSAKASQGAITVDTLSTQWVSFAGNATAIVAGGVLSIGLSLLKPQNFDWEITRNLKRFEKADGLEPGIAEKEGGKTSSELETESEKGDFGSKTADDVGVGNATSSPSSQAVLDVLGKDVERNKPDDADAIDVEGLNRNYKRYGKIFAVLALIITIVYPVPLSAAPYIWSTKFFSAILVLTVVYLFVTAFLVIFLPLIESRKDLARLWKKIFRRGSR